MYTKARRGFTLIEILIVVVIIGILAALVLPNLTRTAEDAARGTAKSQLATVRGQIELYRLRHNGAIPPAAGSDGTDTLWESMTMMDEGRLPLLQRRPVLPMGYTWSFDGVRLKVAYEGRDTLAVADAPTW